MQPLDETQAVDTRRQNLVDTITHGTSMTHARTRDMHQHAGKHYQTQPLDDSQSVDTRRGNPVDTHTQDISLPHAEL